MLEIEIEEMKGKNKRYSTSQHKPFEGIPREADKAVEKIAEIIGPWSIRCWETEKEKHVHITQVIEKKDSSKMIKAKDEDIAQLLRRSTKEISQAYLQGCDELMRDIYLGPKKELNLQPEQILKVMKPLHGLAGSGDKWHSKLKPHLIKELSGIILQTHCQTTCGYF